MTTDRQCPSCGGFCKETGCERENVPPKREWQGLTKEDKREIIDETEPEDRGSVMALVEAKLKEKNEMR